MDRLQTLSRDALRFEKVCLINKLSQERRKNKIFTLTQIKIKKNDMIEFIQKH